MPEKSKREAHWKMPKTVSHDRIILGLGLTGCSCARYFRQKNLPFVIYDTRLEPPGLRQFQLEFPEVKVHCGPLSRDCFIDAKQLIVSPGVSLAEPAVARARQKGVNISSDIDIFCEAVNQPIVAITGTNAKSTVTTLVGEMCGYAGKKVGVGGNLGTPVLDLINAENELYVLELSSFQLERSASLKAEVATVLNISPDHLDRYIDLQAYRRAKLKIFDNCRQLVVNRCDPLAIPPFVSGLGDGRMLDNTEDDQVVDLNKVKHGKKVCFSFGLNEPVGNGFGVTTLNGRIYLADINGPLMAVDDLKIKGTHNVANALAALAVGSALGLTMASMLECLQSFVGLKHRCQWVADIDQVTYFNDSKGTNVGASVAAIHGLATRDKQIILIAGGVAKGAEFSDLGKVLAAKGKIAVLIGEDATQIAATIRDDVDVLFARTMDEAVRIAAANAVAGDIVLLSPACASFDMFENFEQRGDCYIRAVEALA